MTIRHELIELKKTYMAAILEALSTVMNKTEEIRYLPG